MMTVPSPSFKARFDRLGQPRPDVRPGLQAVDDDFDVVLDLAVEREVVGQRDDLAVDPART